MSGAIQSQGFSRYWPLLSLALVALLAACALASSVGFHVDNVARYFMGVFLVVFSNLKLFRPAQFSEAFQLYDPLAMRFPIYAKIYPAIELLLGLAYLAGFLLAVVNIVLVLLFLQNAFGVLRVIKTGRHMKCACMGTVVDLPLSIVTLTEDVVMVVMAVWMLF